MADAGDGRRSRVHGNGGRQKILYGMCKRSPFTLVHTLLCAEEVLKIYLLDKAKLTILLIRN